MENIKQEEHPVETRVREITEEIDKALLPLHKPYNEQAALRITRTLYELEKENALLKKAAYQSGNIDGEFIVAVRELLELAIVKRLTNPRAIAIKDKLYRYFEKLENPVSHGGNI